MQVCACACACVRYYYARAPRRGAPPQRRVRRAERHVARAARRVQHLARREHAEREGGAEGARRRLALRQHRARRVALAQG